MALFSSFDISASCMTALRLRSDTISQILANVNTTRTSDGGPYVSNTVVFTERQSTPFDQVLLTTSGRMGNGVKVTSVIEDTETPMNMVYDPSHPDADENGYVTYPNVNVVQEMTDLIDASRSYEANISAFNASKTKANKGLTIGEQ